MGDLQKAVQLSIEQMQAQAQTPAQAQKPEATISKKLANPMPDSPEERVAEQPRPRARFIKDNVQRKGALKPGEAFQHSWRLKNNGNQPWPHDVTAQCTGGDPLVGADAQVQLPFSPVQAGDAVDIQVHLVAPETPEDKDSGVDADWVAVGEMMRNSLSSQQNNEVT